jgi:hypothetical protein
MRLLASIIAIFSFQTVLAVTDGDKNTVTDGDKSVVSGEAKFDRLIQMKSWQCTDVATGDVVLSFTETNGQWLRDKQSNLNLQIDTLNIDTYNTTFNASFVENLSGVRWNLSGNFGEIADLIQNFPEATDLPLISCSAPTYKPNL